MKTIFIPIQNRLQARNILRTDVLKTLLSDIETRVVLFAPIFKVDEYKKEFVADNLIIEGIKEMNSFLSRTDLTFNRLSLFYLDNPNARFLRKQWLFFERKKPIKYFISISLLLIFGNIKILRKINQDNQKFHKVDQAIFRRKNILRINRNIVGFLLNNLYEML